MRAIMALVAVAAILWGANFNLSKLVVQEMPPLLAGAGRFVLAAMVMGVMVAWQRQTVPLIRHFRAYAMLGLVGIGGFNLLFFMGMQMTSAVNGALIMAVNPLATAFLAALFLGERLSRRQMVAMPVALAGVAIVVLGGGASLSLSAGDALMLGANLSWAVYNVLSRRLMPAESGLVNTTGIMVMGAVVMSLAALVVGVPVRMPSPMAAQALVAMAIGGSALAYLFWNMGLARLGAGRTAVFLNLVPVSTMAIAAAGGQPPSMVQIIGAAVVLAAVSAPMVTTRRPLTVTG
ncbi:DMT family transporter [Magnetospirillum sulfuroxidans]|uniref:DMT family transporter n=1 Tax=Magnetospirillum sulfuroxidans TaxID=611300 RepID=A0ABS5IGR4_9PROT|nr:DMT family transporter [Magnetospirillum sulfuroxidans]MBR9973377.1 DMT family transporter [Magnetospirillum sulfuroxidans]